MKDSRWRFDKINSMIAYFYKTGGMNGRFYVKIPLRSSAILNLEKDICCLLWSILAYLHPCNNNQPSRVSNYKQYSIALDIEGFVLINGFKSSDLHIFEKLNKLSINIFQLNVYQDQNKWKHKLIPI